MIWDAEFIEERERDAQEKVKRTQLDADWNAANAQFAGEMAEHFGCHRTCNSRSCRRARRCTGDAAACLKRAGISIPHDVAYRLIEDIYAETQESRREAEELEQNDAEMSRC
jgi:hypothetical protein